jgi:hypothetical protein
MHRGKQKKKKTRGQKGEKTRGDKREDVGKTNSYILRSLLLYILLHARKEQASRLIPRSSAHLSDQNSVPSPPSVIPRLFRSIENKQRATIHRSFRPSIK